LVYDTLSPRWEQDCEIRVASEATLAAATEKSGVTMRRILLGALFVSAITAGALHSAAAADLPVKAAGVVLPPITGPLWEGIYVGGNIGGAWTNTTWCTDAIVTSCGTGAPIDVISQSPKGLIGGGQFGDRWQWGNVVAGLEATLDGVDASVTSADPVFPSTTRTTRFTGLYTFTGQAGWAFDRLLVYGKGGWASTRLSFQANTGVAGPNLTASNFTDGWTAGAGVEYQVIPHLIVGVEYDYYRFDAKNLGGVVNSAGVTIPCAFCNFGSSTTMQTVLARISIQSGPIPGPGY
jgi:outer membrane immunogenic protein